MLFATAAIADVMQWQREFPKADFSKTTVPYKEILSGGVPRDAIPAIDTPLFKPAHDVDLTETEPVIGIEINGQYKAYPLRILMWHEIVNDHLAGQPITVTYCPLCNAAIVFNRTLEGQILDFGTTGRLRHSDLVMYDRQTESFFQQAMGVAIMGTLAGKELEMLPARIESFANYKKRAGPNAPILVPTNPRMRNYGINPYAGYEKGYPFLYKGELPDGINPMQRVITTQKRDIAYSLALLRERGEIKAPNDVVFRWSAGQNSALDGRLIAKGRDIGNVTATQNGKDIVYFIEFAFVYHAFSKGGQIIQ